MRRLGVLAVAVLVLLGAGAATAAPPATSQLRVSGVGGQSAVLTVPAGGLRIDYPFFSTPRLAGPDGSIGGVLIQDLRTRAVVGGLLLQNVPGFSVALELGLVGFDGVRLRPGRYAFTLLGSERQTVTLPVRRDGPDVVLDARGSARPITSTAYAASPAAHLWSDPISIGTARSIVVLGRGSGGELQQASAEQACFRPAAEDELCLQPDMSSTFVAPGAGSSASWATMMLDMGSEQAGDYHHSGRIASVGPANAAAHSSVIISVPR
jgi:hypothetical protein